MAVEWPGLATVISGHTKQKKAGRCLLAIPGFFDSLLYCFPFLKKD
jgi:hypothetical protein